MKLRFVILIWELVDYKNPDEGTGKFPVFIIGNVNHNYN